MSKKSAPQGNTHSSINLSGLLVCGVVLILAAMAIFQHLNFSIEHETFLGKDWDHHAIDYLVLEKTGLDLTGILKWHREAQLQIAHYPPLHYLLSASFASVFNLLMPAPLLFGGAIWIAVLAGCLYGIGRRLGKSPWAGLVALSLGGLSGNVLSHARTGNLEFVNLTAIVMVFYLYLRTESFHRRLACLAFGLGCGLAVLAKSVTIIHFGPLVAIAFVFTLNKKQIAPKTQSLNILLAAGAAFLLAAWYYIPLWDRVIHMGAGLARNPAVNIAANWPYYTGHFFPFLASPFTAALGLGGLAVAIYKKDRLALAIPVAAAISFCYILTVQSNFISYIYPFEIYIAILAASAMKYFPKKLAVASSVLLALLFLSPLTFESALRGTKLFRKPPQVLKLIYPGTPRHTAILPLEAAHVPWQPVGDVGRILSLRYPEFAHDEIGVLEYAEPTNYVKVGYTLSRAGEPGGQMILLKNLAWFGPSGINHTKETGRITGLPVIAVTLPGDPELLENPVLAGFQQAVAMIRQTHHLDFTYRIPKTNAGGNRDRIEFYVK